jgi:hypothetical protein
MFASGKRRSSSTGSSVSREWARASIATTEQGPSRVGADDLCLRNRIGEQHPTDPKLAVAADEAEQTCQAATACSRRHKAATRERIKRLLL